MTLRHRDIVTKSSCLPGARPERGDEGAGGQRGGVRAGPAQVRRQAVKLSSCQAVKPSNCQTVKLSSCQLTRVMQALRRGEDHDAGYPDVPLRPLHGRDDRRHHRHQERLLL